MAVSGWCSTHGRPQCERCRSAQCTHSCHEARDTESDLRKPTTQEEVTV